MKAKRFLRILPVLVLALVLLIGASTPTSAATGDVAIDSTNFPDAAFRTYVSANFDKNSDGYLSAAEIAAATEINVYNKGISSMKGVEHFAALQVLSCGGNAFTSLDLSKNRALTDLYCYNSAKLNGLDVSSHSALARLDAENCTALKWLYCCNCALTTLVVNGCTALESLDCCNNKLTSLSTGGLTALKTLKCDSNQLTALELSQNTALITLNCSTNQLKALNLDACSTLQSLNVSYNSLTNLHVSKHAALQTLDAGYNTGLTELSCSQCNLTSLTVTGCRALTKSAPTITMR